MHYLKDIESFVCDKKVFCGIDVHKDSWSVCLLCDGEVVEDFRIATDIYLLFRYLEKYSSARELQIVYEAGFCGFWLYRRLQKAGYVCIVTPPALVPQSGSKVKTDRRDARELASYLSAGLLKSVYVLPANVEADRRIIRRRRQLVRKINRAKNEIKSFLHLHEVKRPEEIRQNFTKAYMKWLSELEFEYGSDGFTLKSLISHYRRLRDDLAEVTRYLRDLSKSADYKVGFNRLTAAPGVGLITAMTFLLEIYDFQRFRTSKQFGSFLGLTPSQHSSGPNQRMGHISRQGNTHVREMLVESAWTVIRYDPHLRDKYDRIKAKGTNGKKAIVAVARSLAVRLRRCLIDEVDYVVGVC